MNIFLTGQINKGKSTILDEFLASYAGKVGGYKTVRVKTELDDFFGVYLLDVKDDEIKPDGLNRAGRCFADKSLICYENVFNTLGAQLLSDYNDCDLMIMDEVGVLEKDCLPFLDKITEVLDAGTHVLGVIKQKDTLFLNDIKSRDDVLILEVDGRNNRRILKLLKESFSL